MCREEPSNFPVNPTGRTKALAFLLVSLAAMAPVVVTASVTLEAVTCMFFSRLLGNLVATSLRRAFLRRQLKDADVRVWQLAAWETLRSADVQAAS